MKTSCEIITDLLPLYHDDVCSTESRKLVDEHLQECDVCKSMLVRLDNEILLPKQSHDDMAAIKKISLAWRKDRIMSFIKGLMIALGICITLFTIYLGSTELRLFPVKTNVMKVSDVCILENGFIAFRLEITDEFEVPRGKEYTHSNGNTYLTLFRAFFKDKKHNTGENWYNGGYNIFQVNDIDAFYVGSPKDSILVWEKGMILPSASLETEEDIRQMFIFEE